MTWHEISIVVPFEYVEPISYLFDHYGHGVTMEAEGEDRVLLRTYLPSASRQRLARIEVGVKLASVLEPLGELVVRPVSQDEDWQNAWKEHFTLLKVGKRLVIKPSWIEYGPAPGDVLVDLDPGMAFGTGYHPTTYTCLEALEEMVTPGMQVLDLGTGSGILAIAAAKLGAGAIVALDTDPVAVRAARQNFRRTGTQPKISLAQGTVPHPLAEAGRFHLAVANISSRAIIERGRHVLPLLQPKGPLIASGIIKDQQGDTEDALRQAGYTSIEVRQREDWVTLVCRSDASQQSGPGG